MLRGLAPSLTQPPTSRLLEAKGVAQPVPQRLLAAAGRLLEGGAVVTLQAVLRADQVPVFRRFSDYLVDVATRPEAERTASWCRIVLPPRTGKTVIAAEIIARTALVSTFVVPTLALREQTERELRRLLPGVPVGVLDGGVKRPVAHGVNVITYASLQRQFEQGTLPAPLRAAALIFVDEAHHAMTDLRQQVLKDAFAAEAIRVALTATPDYDEQRRLARYFPDLVHELELDEAVALGLLAPVRVWVAEVDANASDVRLLAGDYDSERLGALMSDAPFVAAARAFRYAGDNRRLPAMISCCSRQQAHDLWAWLAARRPAGTPPPALVLGETPAADRQRVLADFAAGRLDTLIQVGVLIEGWDAPRCKLLIDLAPSVSRVRATQKYFRVMTRHADQEARIVVLLPDGLPRPPLLPMDLLLRPGEEYYCGALIGRDETARSQRRPLAAGVSPIDRVRVRPHVRVCAPLRRPELDPRDDDALRQLLESCPDFDPDRPCNLQAFRRLWLDQPSFTGSGESLLRWCGVRYWTQGAFWALMDRLFPEAMAVRRYGSGEQERWCDCQQDLALLLAQAGRQADRQPLGEALRALGGARSDASDPEQEVLRREALEQLGAWLATLRRRERRALELRFGLDHDAVLTWLEVGERLGVCRERARQIVTKALRRLQRQTTITRNAPAIPCARPRTRWVRSWPSAPTTGS